MVGRMTASLTHQEQLRLAAMELASEVLAGSADDAEAAERLGRLSEWLVSSGVLPEGVEIEYLGRHGATPRRV